MPQAISLLTDGDLTGRIINVFYRAYDELGYGFVEKVYANTLAIELACAGIAFEREVPVDVYYKGQKVGHYRADFVIERRIVLELKACRAVDDADRRQLLNYLRATSLELGLLLHFGPKPAFKRLIFENRRKHALPRR